MAVSTQHVNGNGRKAKAVASKYGKPAQAASGTKETREERGREIFESGAVERVSRDSFQVSGYTVNVASVQCDCKDKEFNLDDASPCKHLYAAKFYIEAHDQAATKAAPFYSKKIMTYHTGEGARKAAPKPSNQAVKPISSDDRIARTAAISSAVAILSTHNEPISYDQVVELAGRLQEWTETGKAKPAQSAAEKYAYMYE